MKVITRDQVAKALDEVVAKAVKKHGPDVNYFDVVHAINPATFLTTGDAYAACQYVVEDRKGRPHPGCIAGQVLDRLGVDIDGLDGHGTMYGIVHLIEAQGFQFEPDALVLLNKAQKRQDDRETWVQAVAVAKQAVFL